MLTYNQMIQFITVARNRSFTKASENLMVAQSAISANIKKIEKEYNINLFYYEKKQLKLTEDGTKFFKIISEIVALMDQLDTIAPLNAEEKDKQPQKHFYYYASASVHTAITPKLALYDMFPQYFFSTYTFSRVDELVSILNNNDRAFTILLLPKIYMNMIEELFPEHTIEVISTFPVCLITSIKNKHPVVYQGETYLNNIKSLPLVISEQVDIGICSIFPKENLNICIEVANSKMVNDILKKRTAFFSLGPNIFASDRPRDIVHVPIKDAPMMSLVFIHKNENALFFTISRALYSLYNI